MRKAKEVTIDDVAQFFQTCPGGVLINVLTPERHALQHIPGSISACVFETVFLDNMRKLVPDLNTPVLVYGAGNCHDSTVAAEKLLEAGWIDVRVFSGGIERWKASALPLEGDEPHAPLLDAPAQVPLFRDYVLVPADCLIRWTGRNDSKSHWGSLRTISGELHFDGVLGSGSLVADMTSIANDDLAGTSWRQVLLDHLASDDFFHTNLFPEAVMEIINLSPLSGAREGWPNYRVEARIGIRGHEEVIEVDLGLRNLPDNRMALSGQIDLDRTLWGVLYGSGRFFRYLGMHKVDDLISLDARFIFAAH